MRKFCASHRRSSSNCAAEILVSLENRAFSRWHVPCVGFIRNQWTARVCRPVTLQQTNNPNTIGHSMKIRNLLTTCGIAAALMLSAGTMFAQNDNGGGNGGDNNGGGRRNRGGGGNFDPAQMQQRMMDRIQEQLGITNDTDWSAVQPLVQKVMDAQRDARRRRHGPAVRSQPRRQQQWRQQRRQSRRVSSASPARKRKRCKRRLMTTRPAAQIKDLLAKYKASQKAKQAKLEAAQADLAKRSDRQAGGAGDVARFARLKSQFAIEKLTFP